MNKIGIDIFDTEISAASVDYNSARPVITQLDNPANVKNLDENFLSGSNPIFSVKDENVIVKQINISSQNDPLNLKIQFELKSSLLEDESEFLFSSHETTLNNLQLGYIIRKNNLPKIQEFLQTDENLESNISYRCRALALGKGYQKFYFQEPGELICLADFASASGSYYASLCFMYHNKIISTTYFKFQEADSSTTNPVQKMITEFKMTINYHLSSIFELGITVPLAAIVLSGKRINDDLQEKFQNQIKTAITRPRINPGFLSKSLRNQMPVSDCFLTALGLTID